MMPLTLIKFKCGHVGGYNYEHQEQYQLEYARSYAAEHECQSCLKVALNDDSLCLECGHVVDEDHRYVLDGTDRKWHLSCVKKLLGRLPDQFTGESDERA